MKCLAAASFGIALIGSIFVLQIYSRLLYNENATKLSIKQLNVMCHSPKGSELEALN